MKALKLCSSQIIHRVIVGESVLDKKARGTVNVKTNPFEWKQEGRFFLL